ncbi:MAG: FG-GAP and VCBS repeat-containing protein [Verrucomicrobiales bacterium]|nr:FG-GAP and VCBS repeat-containing protein [Verrucomicrobiales bacterium]
MNKSTIVGALLIAAAFASAQGLPPLVQQKCSTCHPAPRPTSLPRHAWEGAHGLMVELMAEQKIPITAEESRDILSFYLANSPEALPQIPDTWAESRLKWTKGGIGNPPRARKPEINNVQIFDIDGDGAEDDIICMDNLMGAVTWIHLIEGRWREKVIAFLPSPVRANAVDFDRDGDLDLVVSVMGDIYPNELLTGEVHLLLNDGTGVFTPRVLLEGVARVADCAPADMDGDGDIDFVVAMFGWRKTGGIGLLRQREDGEFDFEILAEINGTMRVIINQANGDDRPDFVALVTQQHESIVQFLNEGDQGFSNRLISQAQHPAFGSSSIHLADLDQDGDEDIVYTNGDMMDENPEPKPYHGARWLENDGKGRYAIHPLVGMPGCYDAEPVDMDGDGDLDLVVSSLYFHWDLHDFPSLGWLENLGGFRNFAPQKIAYAPSHLVNIAVGDLDQDGKPDVVGGGMHVPGPSQRRGRVTLWRQE